MKKLYHLSFIHFFILFFALMFVKESNSQNAFSDAESLSRYRLILKKQLETILTLDARIVLGGICTPTQITDLENLKKFINNPWNDSIIGKLNFKVVLELPVIIANLKPGFIEYVKAELEKLKSDYLNIKAKLDSNYSDSNNTKNQIDTLKNILNKNDSLIKTEIMKLSDKYRKDTSLAISKLRIELVKDTVSLSQKLNEIQTSLNKLRQDSITNRNDSTNKENALSDSSKFETDSPVFKSNFEGVDKSFSIFANVKESEIQDANLSKPFKLTEAALIEAIVDAITQQVLNDAYTLLINNIVSEELANELNVLFPKTIKKLTDTTITEGNLLQNFNSLKRIFNDDLSNMLSNITNEDNYEGSTEFKEIKDSLGVKFYYLKMSVDLINILKEGIHPSQMIPMLIQKSKSYNNKFKEYFTYLEFIDALQKSVREKSESNSLWVNFTKIDELTTVEVNNSSASYLLGFIYQQDRIKFKVFKDSLTTNDKFDTQKYFKFKEVLKDFVSSLNIIESNIKSFSSGNTGSVETYLINIKNIVCEINKSKEIAKYVLDSDGINKLDNSLKEADNYIGLSISIYKSIHDGSYASLLTDIIKIFGSMLKNHESNFIKNISKYTTLFIDVANAKSQEELNSAINKAVGNYGGYLRKREKNFVVSVNSYPGFYIGSEKINGANNKAIGGFTMPLGLNVQLCKYLGIFGQVFDLTAAFNWRFSDTTSSNLPENVTFRQMLSPGLFLSLAPFKIPLVFNIGCAYTPELRTLNTENISLEKSRSFRWSAGIFYDVPLFHLWSLP